MIIPMGKTMMILPDHHVSSGGCDMGSIPPIGMILVAIITLGVYVLCLYMCKLIYEDSPFIAITLGIVFTCMLALGVLACMEVI